MTYFPETPELSMAWPQNTTDHPHNRDPKRPTGETMRKSYFTPGPWQVYSRSGDATDIDIYDSRGGWVARANRASNAKLIASAPELLSVCEAILVDDDQVELLADATVAMVKAAVARAKGNQ